MRPSVVFHHWLLLLVFGPALPLLAAKSAESDNLFSGSEIPRIQIEISRPNLVVLRNRGGWGNGQERPTVRATVREGNTVFTNVAVHLKGAAGSFRPIDQNPCLTLNFDKFEPGQSFHGVHKISLNNSVQDSSYLAEKISRELFEAAGVPVPRAGHAKVKLNGRDLGLYVMTEGFNQQFLKRYFTNTKGNLFDGGFVQDITAPLGVNSGENPRDRSGLEALAAAASEPDSSKRFARLEQVLDMDRFLSFVAMDVIECDWDGYAMNRNNWRVFHDLESHKMVFMPHGLDQMFGIERATPDCPILPSMQGLVARAVVGTPEGRWRYIKRVSELYTNVFQVNSILKRVDQLAEVIRPALYESGGEAATRQWNGQVRYLKSRIVQRGESLRRQLASVTFPVKFDSKAGIRLAGWKPRVQSGAPSFRGDEEQAQPGRLSITVPGADTIASWRTRVLLDQGSYRFEGKIRTTDLKTGPGEGGAGLRISGGPITPGLSGTSEWRPFAYPFQVREGGSEVELVCEVRASKGEASFDTASLQLIRTR